MLALIIVGATLLAYTWIGYPLLIAALAVLRRSPPQGASGARPSVTMILATRDSNDAIRERVADLAGADYPRELLDVVVSLDAGRPAGDGPRLDDLGTRAAVVAGDTPGGKSGALNAAVRAARGEVLVFADTAQRFEATTVPRLVEALMSNPRLGSVSGALHIARPAGRLSAATLYWDFERRLRRDEARVHSAVGVTGAVYAMRRDLWIPLPAGLILDDVYAPMQLVLRGFRVGFEEGAVARDARHFAPETEFRRKARTLTGVLQLCAWLPAVLRPVRNPIWLQFVSHKLLRLATPWLVVMVVVGGSTLVARALPPVYALATVVALGAAALLPALVSPRMRELVVGLVMVQAAVLKATFNAVRGDWDVWHG